MMKKCLAAALVSVAALLGSSAASAANIGFEEVTDFTDTDGKMYHQLDTAYGVRWTGGRYEQQYWAVFAPGRSPWFPYEPANYAHSGNNYLAAYMNEGLDIRGTNITLTSMWARVGGLVTPYSTVKIWAYKNGQEIAQKSFEMSETYQFLDINMSGADVIYIAGPYGWLLADDIVLTNAGPVPEPETYAMLLAGLGILGFAARRKRMAA